MSKAIDSTIFSSPNMKWKIRSVQQSSGIFCPFPFSVLDPMLSNSLIRGHLTLLVQSGAHVNVMNLHESSRKHNNDTKSSTQFKLSNLRFLLDL
jgi:hypothetical protein